MQRSARARKSTAFCNYDPNDNGTQAGLNPALISVATGVKQIVTAIKESPAWHKGHNAIVVVWDENDYSVPPIINQVVTSWIQTTGSTDYRAQHHTHFSLMQSMEGGFGCRA